MTAVLGQISLELGRLCFFNKHTPFSPETPHPIHQTHVALSFMLVWIILQSVLMLAFSGYEVWRSFSVALLNLSSFSALVFVLLAFKQKLNNLNVSLSGLLGTDLVFFLAMVPAFVIAHQQGMEATKHWVYPYLATVFLWSLVAKGCLISVNAGMKKTQGIFIALILVVLSTQAGIWLERWV